MRLSCPGACKIGPGYEAPFHILQAIKTRKGGDEVARVGTQALFQDQVKSLCWSDCN